MVETQNQGQRNYQPSAQYPGYQTPAQQAAQKQAASAPVPEGKPGINMTTLIIIAGIAIIIIATVLLLPGTELSEEIAVSPVVQETSEQGISEIPKTGQVLSVEDHLSQEYTVNLEQQLGITEQEADLIAQAFLPAATDYVNERIYYQTLPEAVIENLIVLDQKSYQEKIADSQTRIDPDFYRAVEKSYEYYIDTPLEMSVDGIPIIGANQIIRLRIPLFEEGKDKSDLSYYVIFYDSSGKIIQQLSVPPVKLNQSTDLSSFEISYDFMIPESYAEGTYISEFVVAYSDFQRVIRAPFIFQKQFSISSILVSPFTFKNRYRIAPVILENSKFWVAVAFRNSAHFTGNLFEYNISCILNISTESLLDPAVPAGTGQTQRYEARESGASRAIFETIFIPVNTTLPAGQYSANVECFDRLSQTKDIATKRFNIEKIESVSAGAINDSLINLSYLNVSYELDLIFRGE